MLSIKKFSVKTLLVFSLCFVLIFNQTAQRAHAFVPVVIGGLAVGEAVFYLAGAMAAGFTLYEAYDAYKNDSMSMRWIQSTGKVAWSKLSSSAKSAWATLEESVRSGAKTIELTATQWSQAVGLGMAAFTSELKSAVPAINIPTKIDIGLTEPIPQTYIRDYSVLSFAINGHEFELVPTLIVPIDASTSTGATILSYQWVHHEADGTYKIYSYPEGTSAFLRETMRFKYRVGLEYPTKDLIIDSSVIRGFEYQVGSIQDAFRVLPDAILGMQGYLLSVYGGLAISAPWAPSIPADKADQKKAVPIPVPTGALDTPGSLTLDPAGVMDRVKEMVGDTVVPGQPPLDWNDTPTDKINFEPLKIGPILTKKFPFSIPWDIGRQFAVFDVSPKTPVIKVNKEVPVFGTTMKLKFDIDFSLFDNAVVVVRWFLIILFDLGMILSIRRFLPE
ncbi:hypothetical protein [Campylobacter jejuni]